MIFKHVVNHRAAICQWLNELFVLPYINVPPSMSSLINYTPYVCFSVYQPIVLLSISGYIHCPSCSLSVTVRTI
jgi:DNA-directed RNA polymerase subunit RPC12/RpoP